MSTRIRLRRVGRKKVPLYRIVVADRDAPRDGRFIEVLGTYNPKADGAARVTLDAEKARAWLTRGATPTETVGALLRRVGVLERTGGARGTGATGGAEAGRKA